MEDNGLFSKEEADAITAKYRKNVFYVPLGTSKEQKELLEQYDNNFREPMDIPNKECIVALAGRKSSQERSRDDIEKVD